MKKIIAAFLISFLLVSCKKEAPISDKNSLDSLSMMSANDSLQIQDPNSFQPLSIPEEVQGCSCTFSVNKEEFNKNNFIFVDDYGAKSFVKYKNEVLEFPMEEGDFDPSHFDRTLKNEKGFILKMKAVKRNENPELMIFEGEMKLITPEGKSINSTFYGKCGC